MLVMFDVTDPCRVHTMTKGEGKGEVIDLRGLLARDADFVRAAVEALVQAALEGGDDRGDRCCQGRAHRDPVVIPQRLLQPLDHPGFRPARSRQ